MDRITGKDYKQLLIVLKSIGASFIVTWPCRGLAKRPQLLPVVFTILETRRELLQLFFSFHL